MTRRPTARHGAADTGEEMPRLAGTWSAAIASELISTITAEIALGAWVCSVTHSGSPVESIAQQSASTPIRAASDRYGRSAGHGHLPRRGHPAGDAARGDRQQRPAPRRPGSCRR